MIMETKNLSASAQDAGLNSTGKSEYPFYWKWWLKDLVQDKPVTVFSTFSCGGGSTMGYKRAGFRVLGNVEIDPRMNTVYVNNHHPKYNYLMDLRDFNKLENLPDELYHLDILDGSPPCSVFSTAGEREKGWNKEKVFREGQKKQRLDDLFFVFLDTVEKLKPKIVIAENVTGLVKGNAKGYVNEIVSRFKELGYAVQLFQLNAAYMGVPQSRERVFFVANNQGYPKLKLNFQQKPILFGEVREENGVPLKGGGVYSELLKKRKKSDVSIKDISVRERGVYAGYNSTIARDERICGTVAASGCMFRGYDGCHLTKDDLRNVGTFPQDYDFGKEQAQYIVGMSVPPNMTANIAAQIWEQWLKNEKCD